MFRFKTQKEPHSSFAKVLPGSLLEPFIVHHFIANWIWGYNYFFSFVACCVLHSIALQNLKRKQTTACQKMRLRRQMLAKWCQQLRQWETWPIDNGQQCTMWKMMLKMGQRNKQVENVIHQFFMINISWSMQFQLQRNEIYRWKWKFIGYGSFVNCTEWLIWLWLASM